MDNGSNIYEGPMGSLTSDPEMSLLTSEEFAQLRRCSTRVIERERADGTGSPFLKLGRRVYYRVGDVRAFLASRVRQSTSEATTLIGAVQ